MNNHAYLSNDMLGLGALLKCFGQQPFNSEGLLPQLNTVCVIFNHLLHINRERHIVDGWQMTDFCGG